MNPLLNLYLRRMMAAQGGRIAFQGGGADAGASSASGDEGAGAGVSAGVAQGMGGVPGGQDASQPDFGQENVGPDPDTDPDEGGGLKNLFTKVVKNVPPTLGLLLAPPPIKALKALETIANIFGVETGPPPETPPDRAGGPQQPIAMAPTDTTMPVNPGDPFAGDIIKTQRYKDFMLAGYPPDMAEYLVNQLM
jgi:hypothetical protein